MKNKTKKKVNALVTREKLITNIKQNPHNIQAAIRLTAKQTRRTPGSLNQMYYNRANGVKHTGKALFMTLTTNGVLVNVKNSPVARETKRILELKDSLADMSTLSINEKVAFFDFLMGL